MEKVVTRSGSIIFTFNVESSNDFTLQREFPGVEERLLQRTDKLPQVMSLESAQVEDGLRCIVGNEGTRFF